MNGKPTKKQKPAAATPEPNPMSKQIAVVVTRMFAEYLERMRTAGAIDSACGRNWHGWVGMDGATWWLDVSWMGQGQERITAGSLEELKAAAVGKFGE